MRKVEKEEENSAAINPDKQCFHLCIINLVIGTLYCAKVCIMGKHREKQRCLFLCLP